MQLQIIRTSDNSHTIFVPELNEHYHSVHGAVQESEIVFLKNGFDVIKKQKIRILEVGFGTGLNALLTWKRALERNSFVEYVSIEKYPISTELALQLNYSENIGTESVVFETLHSSAWHSPTLLDSNFELRKIETDLVDFQPNTNYFDLIYFDAFAPEKQPHLWTSEIFKKLFESLISGGILCTYSSKGIVKQALRDAAFNVKRLAGPPGKRHVIQAIKESVFERKRLNI